MEICFAVRKFVKSHNNKSFIELLLGPCWEDFGLVLFLEVYGPRRPSQYGPHASSITYIYPARTLPFCSYWKLGGC